MRVLLRRRRTPKVCGASTLRDAAGRRVRLSERRRYSLSAWRADGLRVRDLSKGGRTRARVRAPVRITGGSSLCLRGTAENGVPNGSYRGALRLHRDGRAVIVVNDVSLEHYLYGVVAAEMPASWAAEALKAQAVVARSYALRSRRPTDVFDVYADTRSQVYRGVIAEAPAAVAAVRATRALAVRYGAEVAQTFFHSTSGGRTAANEEGFGGLPVPYLRSVDDPYDSMSPVHEWSVTIADRDAERKLREVLLGELEDIVVAAATPSGRADRVDIVGSEGTIQISGRELRSLLGLRSHWFAIRRED
jgi:stage II sporulation protein D